MTASGDRKVPDDLFSLLGIPSLNKYRISRWKKIKNKVWYKAKRMRDFTRGYCIPSENLEINVLGIFFYMTRICPWCDISMNDTMKRTTFIVKLHWHYKITPWRRRAIENLLRGFLEAAKGRGLVYDLDFVTQPIHIFRPRVKNLEHVEP